MKKTLHRILIGLTVLLLFPVAIATFYEYVRINESEELISTVYKNQLESIVFSVNAYAQDVAENWASRLDLWLRDTSDNQTFNRLVKENPSIIAIYGFTLSNPNIEKIYERSVLSGLTDSVARILSAQSNGIEQLRVYYENNYRKFLSSPMQGQRVVLFFISKNRLHQPMVCIFVIDLNRFLQNHLSPRIQSIARDDFILALEHQALGVVLVSSEKGTSRAPVFDQQGEMWLFPWISIGISLKNQTINELAAQRTREGMVLVGGVLLVLAVGIWFLYTSVKREIQLAQIKSEFISNVSHEIRTPLALITMYIETLEMGRLRSAEKIQEYYGIISKETQRLTGIVNKILGFSRIESGKRQYNLEICNLNDVVGRVLETYQVHLANQGFELRIQADPGIRRILCDQEAVSDAIINLIDNAMKYSRDQKVIELRTGNYKKRVFIEVKDYGLGISRKNQKLVFDKFFRVTQKNLANEVKGTGLGLSIVSEIVKAHKGEVSLQSKLGEGSAFRLYFPAV